MSSTLTLVTYKKVGRSYGVNIYDVIYHYSNGDMAHERHEDDTMGDIQFMCDGMNVKFVEAVE